MLLLIDKCCCCCCITRCWCFRWPNYL